MTDTERVDPSALAAPIVFLDTETTSLNRHTRRIWEVAGIRRDPDGQETRYVAMVDRVDLAEADPAALRIGRFYQRHPRYGGSNTGKAVYDGEVAKNIELLTRGAHLAGAVPSFDEETLSKLLRKHNLCPGWHYHLIDVENLAAGALGWQPPYDSSELSLAFGVDRAGYDAHTALGDALWARDLYDAIMARAAKVADAASAAAEAGTW